MTLYYGKSYREITLFFYLGDYMAKKQSAKAIRDIRFRQIGNLMFYDGWHPDYVYFKTLLKAKEYYPTGIGPRPYDPEAAGIYADAAIRDAQAHANFNNLSEGDSIDEFSQRFTDILAFLKKAYDYELKNETAYFAEKYQQLIDTFSEEERKNIPEIQQCIDMIKNGTGKSDFDYMKFTSLINTIMQGYENAKTITQYEAVRLKQLDNAVTDLLDKKLSQLEGQAKASQWPDAEKKIKKHYDKFKRNIAVTYAEHGTMVTKDKNKQRYLIRGAYRFNKFTQSQQVADRKLAQWVEKMMTQLATNKAVITKLASVIMQSFPLNGDFSHLEEEVRSIIIQGVIEYGRQNLSRILDNRFNIKDMEVLADRLIQSNVFDTVQSFKIEGLPATFGQTVKESNLVKKIAKITDMAQQEKAGEKLYMLVRDLFKEEENFSKAGEQSYLIEAMRSYKKSTGSTAYESADKLISIIQELIKIRDQIEKDNKEILDANDDYMKEYEFEGKYNESATIVVRIKDGKPTVEMAGINQMLVDENIFKKSNSQNLTNLINTLMAQTSIRLKTDIINSLAYAHKNQKFNLSEQQLLNEVAGELRQVKIKIDGPILAEVVEARLGSMMLGKHGVAYHTGQKNNKNDNIFIEVGDTASMRKITSMIQKKYGADSQEALTVETLENILEDAQLKLLLEIQKKGQDAIAAAVKNNNPVVGNVSSQRYLTAAEFSYTNIKALSEKDEEIAKLWNEVKIAASNLKKMLQQRWPKSKDINELNEAKLLNLSNSFEISTTVKTGNTYNNQLGFKGGTLGKDNLRTQLDNLKSIFTYAGLSGEKLDADMDWLYSAIINCSPYTIVGEKNKGLIESYLGAAAAFALFDEGGQENMLISNTYQQFFNSVNNVMQQISPKILHLYRVNSIVVPGSQVLLRTIETLERDVLPSLNQIPEVMNRGAGIMVINHIDALKIPNRPISKSPTDKQPWKTVGERANGKVTLQILFLAGLMDIVNHMNKQLNGIEIPA